MPILKKSGNLFNDPSINKIDQENLETFYDPRIKVPILKKSGNLFNDPRICAHTKKVWKIIY